MKFVSFSTKDFVRAGVLLRDDAGGNDQIVDLAHPSMRAALRDTKPQMLALIDAGLAGAVVRIGAGARCWTAAVMGPSQTRFRPVGIRKIAKATAYAPSTSMV